jgi:hypothetical protein
MFLTSSLENKEQLKKIALAAITATTSNEKKLILSTTLRNIETSTEISPRHVLVYLTEIISIALIVRRGSQNFSEKNFSISQTKSALAILNLFNTDPWYYHHQWKELILNPELVPHPKREWSHVYLGNTMKPLTYETLISFTNMNPKELHQSLARDNYHVYAGNASPRAELRRFDLPM